jgi:hypothetical protein
MQATDSKATQFVTGGNLMADCPRKVYVGTTALWSIDPYFFQCCLKVQAELLEKKLTGQSKIGSMLGFYAGESPVGRSRNSLTAEFLKTDCTDLLFIDSDLIFSAEQIERIVLHEEDVVGGLYQMKCEGQPRICWNHKEGVTTPNEKGLMEVCYIGTGFLRVRRRVFERMVAEFGEDIWYDTDNAQIKRERQYDFWRMGVYKYKNGDRRWLSEDWWFCQKCQDLGIPVYADCSILARHSGNAIYPLSYQHDLLYPKKDLAAPVADSAGASRMTSPLVEAPAPISSDRIQPTPGFSMEHLNAAIPGEFERAIV